MKERPMTKRLKSVAAALTAAMLAAELMAGTPAGAAHDPNISGEQPEPGSYYYEASTITEAQFRYSNDGGSTWTATVQQYLAGEYDPAQDNGDGINDGTFRLGLQGPPGNFSSDGGLTWTATDQEYFAGEHDPTQDNGDGPATGMFRRRAKAWGSYSIDGGLTWRNSFFWPTWHRGEYDPAQDNGDGSDAGTFRWRSTVPEYSIDGGSTWTATMQQYAAGETDPAQDNGDGPGTGTFRSQDAPLIVYRCYFFTRSNTSVADRRTWGDYGSLNNPKIRPCPGPRPDLRDEGSNTYTWNVDDGIVPTGDWCVTGRALADGRSIICRGDGYTYREARRELGFGLGRP